MHWAFRPSSRICVVNAVARPTEPPDSEAFSYVSISICGRTELSPAGTITI